MELFKKKDLLRCFTPGCPQERNGVRFAKKDVKIDDDNSKMIQKVFESVENEEIEYLKQVFSEDLEFTDSHGKILNKEEFIAGVENIFDLFDDIKFKESQYEDHDNLEIETTYYSNGNVWTSIWSEFSAKGKLIIQKLIKGEEINLEQSGLSKREWNELMIAFDLKDKLI